MKFRSLKFVIAVICLLFSNKAFSQDCEVYFPLSEGAEVVMHSFNGKGKLQSIITQKFVSKEEKNGGLEIKIHSTTTDEKKKNPQEADLKYLCKNGVFYIDMNSMLSPQQKESFKGSEMEVITEDMEFPSALNVGTKLKDAKITMKMKSATPINLDFNTTISNRKVEAIESITTPAGTFECFKISQDFATKSAFMTINMKTIEWYSKGVGSVKSETYDSKGKLIASQELASLKK